MRSKRRQRTLAKSAEFTSTALFSGAKVRVRLLPAGADTGVVFVRCDLAGRPRIPAAVDFVFSKMRRTAIRRDGAEVNTVEHILAAACGARIDNMVIEIDGDEVPNADGSALAFYEIMAGAGAVEQDAPRRCFYVTDPVSVQDGDVALIAMPCENGLSISYTLDYDSPLLGTQSFAANVTEEVFAREIAPARTFCLSSEVEELRKRGLGLGATYQNTLVVSEKGVIDNQVRFPDEFARHKVLDVVGDLFLLGADLYARVVGVKSGHSLNLKMVKALRARMQGGAALADTEALDITRIMKILPHRYPFLLVDRVLELRDDKRAVGIKNVTINERFFQGHFPGHPIMPGVLQIEAMAQLAGVLLLRRLEHTGKLAYLLSLDGVKLRRAVVPGDQLRLEAEAVRIKNRTAQVNARALVDGMVAAEAQIKFMLVDAGE